MDEDQLLVPYLRKAEQYEPIKSVGKGCFGSIELVKDKDTEKIYAKKDVPFPPDDESAPLYFFREFLSLKNFQIDGLPFLKLEGFNFPEKGNEAFIVTEYVDGGSLGDLIHNRFKSCADIPTTKMIIIYGIAFAMKILHSRKIVHRDLKPENVLLNKNNEPILADFGFAREISNSIFMTSKLGTLMYMAPELLAKNELESDCSIDVYAFAVLLFQIIAYKLRFNNGISPYPKANEKIFIRHILKGNRFDMPDSDVLPDDFRQLITECWSQSPKDRWPMKRIVKALQKDIILEGCDMVKYKKYVNKLNTIYAKAKMTKVQDEEEVEYTSEFDF